MIGAARLPNISGANSQQVEAYVVGDAVGTSADVAKFGSRSYKAWNGTGNSTTYIRMTPAPMTSWLNDSPNLKSNKEFTAEWWIYMTAAPTTTVNVWQRIDFSTEWRFLMQANRIAQFRYRYYNPYPSTITERVISSNVITALNTWTHLAFTRQEGVVRFFQDGNLIATFTETNFVESGNTSNAYAIGQGVESGMRYYIDELRISDVCRYTASFTPQQTTYSNDNNTVALLKFEESAGSKRFLTSYDPQVRVAKTITANGGAQISTTQSKFGGASALFDGTDDYLSIENNDTLNVGSSNWTAESWIRFDVVTGDRGIFSHFQDLGGGDVRGINMRYNPTGSPPGLRIVIRNVASTAVLQAAWTPSTNTWYHVALVRNNSTLTVYVDGTSIGSTTLNFAVGFPTTAPLVIGQSQTVSNSYFDGYIDEIRYSNTARYTANFTAPTQPFVNDSNTLLLIHADGTNGSTTFTDANR